MTSTALNAVFLSRVMPLLPHQISSCRSNPVPVSSAQVVIVADGYHLWSETFDRGQADTFAVQDEIAHAVARALRVKLLPTAERSKLASSMTCCASHR